MTLFAILYTVYAALAFGGFFYLAGRGELPMNDRHGPGYVSFLFIVSVLILWGVVGVLGWTPWTVLLAISTVVGTLWAYYVVGRTGRLYYPIWWSVLSLAGTAYTTVLLWQHIA